MIIVIIMKIGNKIMIFIEINFLKLIKLE